MPLDLEEYLSIKIMKSFGYHYSSLSNNISGAKKEENHFQNIRLFSRVVTE